MRSAQQCELLFYLLSMEIDLNKVESTETSEFVNFSIREYVAEMHKKDPNSCWPFGSLCDPNNYKDFASYQSTKSTLMSSQNSPGHINVSDVFDFGLLTTSKVEIFNGNEDRTKSTTDMIESLGVNSVGNIKNDGSSGLTSSKVNEGSKIGHNVAADNDETELDQPRRKYERDRLLSDILKDPASKLRAPCDIKNPKNFNARFATEIEDESDDDLTLDEFFRKQKGVKVTDLKSKKKRKLIKSEEPIVNQDKKSNHEGKVSIGNDLSNGPRIHLKKKVRTNNKDTQTMAKHKKNLWLPCSQIINRIGEITCIEAKETGNEDSEMEAVMLLARHFNEETQSANEQNLHKLEINKACACVRKKIKDHSTPFNVAKCPVVYADTPKEIMKEKLKRALYSVQMDDHLTGINVRGVQAQVKRRVKKAAGLVKIVPNRGTLVCSYNKNPADFSIPHPKNKFMRRR